jgi:hypothetical protein
VLNTCGCQIKGSHLYLVVFPRYTILVFFSVVSLLGFATSPIIRLFLAVQCDVCCSLHCELVQESIWREWEKQSPSQNPCSSLMTSQPYHGAKRVVINWMITLSDTAMSVFSIRNFSVLLFWSRLFRITYGCHQNFSKHYIILDRWTIEMWNLWFCSTNFNRHVIWCLKLWEDNFTTLLLRLTIYYSVCESKGLRRGCAISACVQFMLS